MTACTNNEPYALRVLGDSMEPEFKQGEVIIVEPNPTLENGAYVIVLHENEYVFRQLLLADEQWYLKPLNDKYPTVQITTSDLIKGRIVSKSSGKGRQLRSYL